MPAPVLTAMRQTVTNLLGTLPPQFFKVTISTRSDNLAQLMFSVLMTGYMFCNGWYRLQLSYSMRGALRNSSSASSAFDSAALIGTTSTSTSSSSSSSFLASLDDDTDYLGPSSSSSTSSSSSSSTSSSSSNSRMAAGAQKLGIAGEVLRWHHEDGVQQLPALQYIEQLEEELLSLQRQLEAHRKAAAAVAAAAAPAPPRSAIHDSQKNELLEYLKGLSGEQVAELTDCATPDVMEAMNALVRRLIGEDGGEGAWAGRNGMQCSATELAQLLCWLMAVGHQLRTLEVRLSLLASMESIPSSSSSGADPNDGEDGASASDWVPRLPPGR